MAPVTSKDLGISAEINEAKGSEDDCTNQLRACCHAGGGLAGAGSGL
jgi:hypothetical protein